MSQGQYGSVLGINQSFSALSRTICPFISGVLFDVHSFIHSDIVRPHPMPFWAAAVFGLCAWIFMFGIKPDAHKMTEAKPDAVKDETASTVSVSINN